MNTVEKKPIPIWISILVFAAIITVVMIVGMMI